MQGLENIDRLSAHGAGWVLGVLIAASVTGMGIVIERAVLFLSSRDDHDGLRAELRGLLARGELSRARQRLEASPSFEAAIARAGLDAGGAGSAEERMRGEQQLARLRMDRHLGFLGTLGNNAPFIGLLGTVIGIVRAFHQLSTSTGQVSAGLMREIGEALLATAVGLMVALPAVVFFNLFQRTIRARLARGDALGREVLAHLKSEAAAPAE